MDGIFEVRHYAGPVPYVAQGFLEKNKDELPSDAVQLFKDTQGFLQDCCAAFDQETTDVKKKKVTVASQFKTQLRKLMESISSTTPTLRAMLETKR